MKSANLNFEINGKSLIVSGKSIKFPLDIKQVEVFPNSFVVRLEVPTNFVFNENIFGVSKDGMILWQIEKLTYVYSNSPYTGMLREKNFIKLFNWDGKNLIVNPDNGKIIEVEYGK